MTGNTYVRINASFINWQTSTNTISSSSSSSSPSGCGSLLFLCMTSKPWLMMCEFTCVRCQHFLFCMVCVQCKHGNPCTFFVGTRKRNWNKMIYFQSINWFCISQKCLPYVWSQQQYPLLITNTCQPRQSRLVQDQSQTSRTVYIVQVVSVTCPPAAGLFFSFYD